jgi:hypothetical protein
VWSWAEARHRLKNRSVLLKKGWDGPRNIRTAPKPSGASEPLGSGAEVIRLTAPGVRKTNAIVLSNDYGSGAVHDVLPKTP